MPDRLRLLLVPMARDAGREIGRLLANLDGVEHIVATHVEADAVARATEESGADLLLLALAKGRPVRQSLDLVARIAHSVPSRPLVVLSPEPNDDTALAVVRRGAQDCMAVQALLGAEVVGTLQRIVERHRMTRQRHERDRRRAVSTTATGVLDRLPFGVMMLNARGQVLALNAKARRIVAAGDGLMLDRRSGIFRAEDDEQSKAMITLVRRTILDQVGPEGDCALAISRSSLKPPLRLMVLPLAGRAAASTSPRTGVAIFISDPEDGIGPSEDTLRRRYGLTPEETRLALGLARGWRLDEVAAAAGVGADALRPLLEQVFRKTDTKRQAELVKLLLTGPAAPRAVSGE